MPETSFVIRWPDGQVETCYSPSTVVRDYLSADASYSIPDFVGRCQQALEQASRRVEAKFGYRCRNADAQRAAIEAKAGTFPNSADVTCLSIT